MPTLISLLVALALQSPAPATPVPKPAEPAESVDSAWTVLKNALNDKNFDKRQKAVHALGLLTENARAQQIAENSLAKDPAGEVRAEAATALGTMDAKSSQPRLIHAFNDKDVRVVIAAANSLYRFKNPAAYEVYYAILTGERKSSNGLVRSQIDMLRDRKQLELLAFQTGIGFVPFAGAGYQAYKTLTHDYATPVLAVAAERLANDPDPKTTAALGRACSESKWQVRLAVVDAISKRGDPSLLFSVGPLLYDSNDSVRMDAAGAIIHLSSVAERSASAAEHRNHPARDHHHQ